MNTSERQPDTSPGGGSTLPTNLRTPAAPTLFDPSHPLTRLAQWMLVAPIIGLFAVLAFVVGILELTTWLVQRSEWGWGWK